MYKLISRKILNYDDFISIFKLIILSFYVQLKSQDFVTGQH